jgi:Raf kinase inhibitor-like YbhB/YbcL family protein
VALDSGEYTGADTDTAHRRGRKTGHTLPAGAVQGRNDYGYAGFGGACPPVGDKPHPYQFTVWALSTDKLPIDSNASGALVGYMLNSNVIESEFNSNLRKIKVTRCRKFSFSIKR